MSTTTVNSKAATWLNSGQPTRCIFGQTSYLALNRGGMVGLVQFATPTPPGSQNVQQATLTLRTRAHSGAVTITVARLLNPWTPARATWANVNQATADAVTVTRSDVNSDNVAWSFDVTAMVQKWASGTPNYGVLLTTTNGGTVLVQGNMSASVNPTLTATYTQAPLAPTGLAPAAGRRISTPMPILRFDFHDQAGNTKLQAARVQIATDAAMTANVWDSGPVTTAIPQVDLSTLSPKMPAAGTPWWWRVQTQDGSGLWSDWSLPTSAVYTALPSVTFVNPDAASPVVYDPTPPIQWTYTGASAQTRWRVGLYAVDSKGVGRLLIASGDQFGTDTRWTPTKALPAEGKYRVVIDVWDSYTDREATPGAGVYQSQVQDFTFSTNTNADAPYSGRASKPYQAAPPMSLHWTRNDQPDGWRVLRDGVLILQTVTGSELLDAGQANSYSWTDPYAPAGTHVYLIQPIVNNKAVKGLYITTHNSFTGTWLYHQDTGESVCVVSDDDHGLTLPEQATDLDVLGAQVPVRIVTGMQGYQGKADGVFVELFGLPDGNTPRDWYNRALDFKGQVGQRFTLLGVGPLVLPVYIRDMDVAPLADLNGEAWSVSFGYVQCDDFPDGLEG